MINSMRLSMSWTRTFQFIMAAILATSFSVSGATQENTVKPNPFEGFSDASLKAVGAFIKSPPYDTRDDAYDVMREYSECSALYSVMADIAGTDPSEAAMAEVLRGTARGAKMAGAVIFQSYSERSFEVSEGIIESTIPQYHLAIQKDSDFISPKMTTCLELAAAQTWIVEHFRKNVF